jgi:hypothetical protein
MFCEFGGVARLRLMPLNGFRLWLVIVVLTGLGVALILLASGSGHLR